uniref:Arrestin C-terminal-like domain-containing protein n=1 Tax=Trichuris muris TaxID=70415 RepID=A0A5S6R618_TRIMR
MKSFHVFDIVLDTDEGRVMAGSVLTGRLMVSLSAPMCIHQLIVAVKGEMRTKWVDRVSETIFDSIEPIINFNTEMNFDHLKEQEAVPAGNYALPFQFSLPVHLPSSFSAEFGFIRYQCAATAILAPGITCLPNIGKHTKEVTVEKDFILIDVVHIKDFRQANKPLQAEDHFEVVGCCRRTENVDISVRLSQGAFLAGDTAAASLDVKTKNRRRVRRKASVMLVQEALFYAQSLHGTTSSNRAASRVLDEVALEFPDVGQHFEQTVQLRVPIGVQPTTLQNALIAVRYKVKVDLGDKCELAIPIESPRIETSGKCQLTGLQVDMEEVGNQRFSILLSLKSLASRCIVTTLLPRGFGKADFGPLDRLHDDIQSLPVGRRLQEELWSTTMHAMEKVIAWWHRHSALFQNQVDDLRSAQVIFALNENWPQMRFQFACAYAMHERMATFDSIWIRVFRIRLRGHPLYDFWLAYLDQGDRIFDQRGVVPKAPVAEVYSWACCNGFLELIRFLWGKMPPAQREYLTMLTWHRLCRRAENGALFAFLCEEMCKINDSNICRITSQCFLHASWHLCDDESKGDAERQVIFLLGYSCPKLREALFPVGHYNALLMVVRSRNIRALRTMLRTVARSQLIDGLNSIKCAMDKDQWLTLKAVLLNKTNDRSAEAMYRNVDRRRQQICEKSFFYKNNATGGPERRDRISHC